MGIPYADRLRLATGGLRTLDDPFGSTLEIGRITPTRRDGGGSQPVDEVVEERVRHGGGLYGQGQRHRLVDSVSGACGPSVSRRHRPRTVADVVGPEPG